jgi:hypothetical protein
MIILLYLALALIIVGALLIISELTRKRPVWLRVWAGFTIVVTGFYLLALSCL